ncbi:MAG: hypothetical protein K8R69_05090 [Deltaproteobacteria bacterium]|nr:hypothetical protein [Deltaproteobacteria bacterium]
MVFFRRKVLLGVFFFLISFGQAYPYSYAWAMGQDQMECGCNLHGRKCIHGCDLKHRHRGEAAHEGHAAMGHAGHGDRTQLSAAVESEAVPVWVNPDCAKQKHREVLDFRGDPFIPQVVFFTHSPLSLSYEFETPVFAIEGLKILEPPPPKA